MPTDLSLLRDRLQQALGEEFTVGQLLGQGGFAAVFRARDNVLHRDVAIKVLDLDVSPSPGLAERFVREAQTVARLEHPNIVPIYKVGRHRDLLYLVMRCVDGPSLRQLLGDHRRLSVGDAARVTRPVADALAYAHSQGVVHRDVKPDNILVDRSGHVLVTDFGIAKAVEEAAASPSPLTTEGMVIGTPQYMSPEQAAGDPVDGRSDIYSLGIVLYQMLSGAPPFDGTSAASILAKQLTARPPDLRPVRSDVTDELWFVLERMLAKDPAGRFQSAAEVSRALVAALPAAAADRIRIPWRRRLASFATKALAAIALGGCLGMLVFASGGVFALWAVQSGPPRIAVVEPVPDSLVAMLRQRRALRAGDTAELVFAPDGPLDSVVFAVSRGRVAVVEPRRVRSYPRDSVEYDWDVRLRGGLRILFILDVPGERRDTVYRFLSPRAWFELESRVDRVLGEGESGVRVGVRPPGEVIRIERN